MRENARNVTLTWGFGGPDFAYNISGQLRECAVDSMNRLVFCITTFPPLHREKRENSRFYRVGKEYRPQIKTFWHCGGGYRYTGTSILVKSDTADHQSPISTDNYVLILQHMYIENINFDRVFYSFKPMFTVKFSFLVDATIIYIFTKLESELSHLHQFSNVHPLPLHSYTIAPPLHVLSRLALYKGPDECGEGHLHPSQWGCTAQRRHLFLKPIQVPGSPL